MKIDSIGNKQWDKRFGGIKDDFLQSVKQTKDGGYLLAGSSSSGISGNKTQANWDSTERTSDYWIVKIDSVGNKQWDKRFGTTRDDVLHAFLRTTDDGFLIGGGVGDTMSGDNTTSRGGMWLIKINTMGTITWQFSYNTGSGIDFMTNTYDGGYLISGRGFQTSLLVHPPLDRTDDCLGLYNSLVIKLDSNGLKQWDKTIFTTGSDYGGYAIQTKDGCYTIANTSNAGIGGYKTQQAWDSSYDFFIVKFCMDTVTGLNDNQQIADSAEMRVYPNPFENEVSITLRKAHSGKATFIITNALGQVIYRRNEDNLSEMYTKVLDLALLPVGTYYLQVTTNGSSSVKQILKHYIKSNN